MDAVLDFHVVTWWKEKSFEREIDRFYAISWSNWNMADASNLFKGLFHRTNPSNGGVKTTRDPSCNAARGWWHFLLHYILFGGYVAFAPEDRSLFALSVQLNSQNNAIRKSIINGIICFFFFYISFIKVSKAKENIFLLLAFSAIWLNCLLISTE